MECPRLCIVNVRKACCGIYCYRQPLLPWKGLSTLPLALLQTIENITAL
jgi:hypothetical protein